MFIEYTLPLHVIDLFSNQNGPLLCCVGLAWLCMNKMCWLHSHIIHFQDRNTTRRERRGANSWWNPQRTKGVATDWVISDHPVWFTMVCILKCDNQIIIFQIMFQSHQVFIRSFWSQVILMIHHYWDFGQQFESSYFGRLFSNLCL